MNIKEVIVLNITWEKIDFSTSYQELKDKDGPTDYGIYQIYGRHNAYGENALLYIGKAQKQSFAGRLSERWEFIESSAKPTSIRLGRFTISNKPCDHEVWTNEYWEKMIGIAETLLIKAHAPAMNKQENAGLFSGNGLNGEHYLIVNWEEYGSLLPEVSTFRNSYHLWEDNTPVGTKF